MNGDSRKLIEGLLFDTSLRGEQRRMLLIELAQSPDEYLTFLQLADVLDNQLGIEQPIHLSSPASLAPMVLERLRKHNHFLSPASGGGEPRCSDAAIRHNSGGQELHQLPCAVERSEDPEGGSLTRNAAPRIVCQPVLKGSGQVDVQTVDQVDEGPNVSAHNEQGLHQPPDQVDGEKTVQVGHVGDPKKLDGDSVGGALCDIPVDTLGVATSADREAEEYSQLIRQHIEAMQKSGELGESTQRILDGALKHSAESTHELDEKSIQRMTQRAPNKSIVMSENGFLIVHRWDNILGILRAELSRQLSEMPFEEVLCTKFAAQLSAIAGQDIKLIEKYFHRVFASWVALESPDVLDVVGLLLERAECSIAQKAAWLNSKKWIQLMVGYFQLQGANPRDKCQRFRQRVLSLFPTQRERELLEPQVVDCLKLSALNFDLGAEHAGREVCGIEALNEGEDEEDEEGGLLV